MSGYNALPFLHACRTTIPSNFDALEGSQRTLTEEWSATNVMLLRVGADTWEVDDCADAQRLQNFPVADAAEFENLG